MIQYVGQPQTSSVLPYAEVRSMERWPLPHERLWCSLAHRSGLRMKRLTHKPKIAFATKMRLVVKERRH